MNLSSVNSKQDKNKTTPAFHSQISKNQESKGKILITAKEKRVTLHKTWGNIFDFSGSQRTRQ